MEAMRYDEQRDDQQIYNEVESALNEPLNSYEVDGFEQEEFYSSEFDDVDLSVI